VDYDCLTNSADTTGGIVPRAKRTDRAEARRRHRAALAADPDLQDDVESEDDEPAATSGAARRVAPPATRPLERPSLVNAFRSAFRPVDFKGDLRALPSIARHSKAIWLPVLLTVGAAIFYVTSPSTISFILFNYFAYVPPVASIFLAGFLAPRASYMTGFIAGLAGAAVFSAVALMSVGQPLPSGEPLAPSSVTSDLMLAWTVSPISGVFFGAAAGWYKRFLTAANPNRNRSQQRPTDRPRRKGSEQRPLLARKR
jgi:hypothetical protein